MNWCSSTPKRKLQIANVVLVAIPNFFFIRQRHCIAQQRLLNACCSLDGRLPLDGRQEHGVGVNIHARKKKSVSTVVRCRENTAAGSSVWR